MIVRRTIAFASLAFTLSTSLASAQTVERTDVTPMVGAINAERARFSLPPLGRDPRLDAVAEAHSLEMARARFFSHTSPSTGQPADRVSHAGLRWSAVAENIAINQSPEAAQQALLRSPGHHENMVDPVQRSIGVGIVRYGEQVWVTQLFAALNDTAGATPVTVAPAAIDDADDEGDDEGDNEGDDVDEAPTAAPVPAPSAPVAAAAPTAAAAPMIPGFPMQGIPGLDQFLTGLGLTRQPTPAAPAARAGHTPAAPQVYTVQTPFGPVRVEVPSSFAAPSTPAAPPAATPARPRSPRSHRPAPSRGRVIQIDTLDV